jgi:hypothetical protein
MVEHDERADVLLVARFSVSVSRIDRDRLDADSRRSVVALAEIGIDGAVGHHVQRDVDVQGNPPPPPVIRRQSPLRLLPDSLLDLRLEVFHLRVDEVLRHVADELPGGDGQEGRQPAAYNSAQLHLRKPDLKLWGRRLGAGAGRTGRGR